MTNIILIIFLAVTFIVIFIVTFVICVSMRLSHNILVEKDYSAKTILKISFCIVLLVGIFYPFYRYYCYTHPNDAFYFQEFKKVASFYPPSSARIIKKTYSIPDFFGDDSSAALYKFSPDDYNLILKRVQNDPQIVRRNHISGSSNLDAVKSTLTYEQVDYLVYERNTNEKDLLLEISFINDNQSIIIYKFSY